MFSLRIVAGAMRLSKPLGLLALSFLSVLCGLSTKCTDLVSHNPSFQPPVQTTLPIPALRDSAVQVLVHMDVDLLRHIPEIHLLFLENHAETLEQPTHHELVVEGLDFGVGWVQVAPWGICSVDEILGMAAECLAVGDMLLELPMDPRHLMGHRTAAVALPWVEVRGLAKHRDLEELDDDRILSGVFC